MYGKLVALQREIARWSVRGSLRAGSNELRARKRQDVPRAAYKHLLIHFARSFSRQPEAVGDLDPGASVLFPVDRDPRDEELHEPAARQVTFLGVRLVPRADLATTQREQFGSSTPPCSVGDLPSTRSRPRRARGARSAPGPPREGTAIPRRRKPPR